MGILEDDDLFRVASLYHTPLYIFYEQTIRERCGELKRCITYRNHKIRYACKALT